MPAPAFVRNAILNLFDRCRLVATYVGSNHRYTDLACGSLGFHKTLRGCLLENVCARSAHR
jgi:hypothetical protein